MSRSLPIRVLMPEVKTGASAPHPASWSGFLQTNPKEPFAGGARLRCGASRIQSLHFETSETEGMFIALIGDLRVRKRDDSGISE